MLAFGTSADSDQNECRRGLWDRLLPMTRPWLRRCNSLPWVGFLPWMRPGEVQQDVAAELAQAVAGQGKAEVDDTATLTKNEIDKHYDYPRTYFDKRGKDDVCVDQRPSLYQRFPLDVVTRQSWA